MWACVEFEDTKKNYLVDASNIKGFRPKHWRDFSSEATYSIKWQKSELDHDGCYEGKILLLGADENEIRLKARDESIKVHGVIPRVLKASEDTQILKTSGTGSSKRAPQNKRGCDISEDRASKQRQQDILQLLKKKKELESQDKQMKKLQEKRKQHDKEKKGSEKKRNPEMEEKKGEKKTNQEKEIGVEKKKEVFRKEKKQASLSHSSHDISIKKMTPEMKKDCNSQEVENLDWKAEFLKLKAKMQDLERKQHFTPSTASTPKKGQPPSQDLLYQGAISAASNSRKGMTASTPQKGKQLSEDHLYQRAIASTSNSRKGMTASTPPKRKQSSEDHSHQGTLASTSNSTKKQTPLKRPVSAVTTPVKKTSWAVRDHEFGDVTTSSCSPNNHNNSLSDSEDEIRPTGRSRDKISALDDTLTMEEVFGSDSEECRGDTADKGAENMDDEESNDHDGCSSGDGCGSPAPIESEEESIIERINDDLKGVKGLDEKDGKVYVGNGIKINAKFWSDKVKKAKTDKKFVKALAFATWGHDALKCRTVGGKSKRPGQKQATPLKVNTIYAALKGRLRAGGVPSPNMGMYIERAKRDLNEKMYDEGREDNASYRANVKKWNDQRKKRRMEQQLKQNS